MNDKKKMILFFSVGGGVILILLIVLIAVILSNGKGKAENSSIQTGGSTVLQTDSSFTSGQSGTSDMQNTEQTTDNGSKVTDTQDSGTNTDSRGSQTGSKTGGFTTKPSTSTTVSNSKTFNLLTDPGFLNGFKVLGMNTGDGGQGGSAVFNPLESSGRQYWNLAQWGSRYSFNDSKYTTLKKPGNGVFQLVNTTKEFTVDTENAKLTFTGLASKCYDTHRTGSEPWLHVLVEQAFKASDAKVSNLNSVMVSMSNRLTMFEDHMGNAFNPNAHAAQFLMYFSVKNNDPTSDEYNKFIWFGFPLFDNRFEWINPSSMFDKGTSALMVGIGNKVLYQNNGKNNCWKNGRINAGPGTAWSSFKLDVLPLIKNALNTAHNDGYLTKTSIDQLVISGMNLGWEIPGTYDATMEMKDFSVMVTKK